MKRTKALNDSTSVSNVTQQLSAERPAFPQALLDHVMAHYKKPADLIGENGMLKHLTKVVFEAALNAEMVQHLGHTRHGTVGNNTGNVRNGHSACVGSRAPAREGCRVCAQGNIGAQWQGLQRPGDDVAAGAGEPAERTFKACEGVARQRAGGGVRRGVLALNARDESVGCVVAPLDFAASGTRAA